MDFTEFQGISKKFNTTNYYNIENVIGYPNPIFFRECILSQFLTPRKEVRRSTGEGGVTTSPSPKFEPIEAGLVDLKFRVHRTAQRSKLDLRVPNLNYCELLHRLGLGCFFEQ